MERKLVTPSPHSFPPSLQPLLEGAALYDSSCSPQARVWFVDRDGGYYLKRSPKGTLYREAAMTRYFHQLGLAAQVLKYLSDEEDWLLTERVPGEDCTDPLYLEDPRRLCDVMAACLYHLHHLPTKDCPVPNRTADYLATARRNHAAGVWDGTLFPVGWGYATPQEAWHMVETHGDSLAADTLIHGDFCLPNIILDRWRFSGFIDLDGAGVGDRHVDLFWGAWTLVYNLKTDKYCDRFLDAYGREYIDADRLRVVAAAEAFG